MKYCNKIDFILKFSNYKLSKISANTLNFGSDILWR